MKVRFTSDAIHETEGRGRGRQFRTGRVYDLPDDQAQRWIRRNAAEALPTDDDSKADDEEEKAEPASRRVSKGEAVHPAVAASQRVPRGKTPLERTHTADFAVEDEDAVASRPKVDSPSLKEAPEAPVSTESVPITVDDVPSQPLPGTEDEVSDVPEPVDPDGGKAVDNAVVAEEFSSPMVEEVRSEVASEIDVAGNVEEGVVPVPSPTRRGRKPRGAA